jgi:hypothetical protein
MDDRMVKAVAVCALLLGACRAEPSRAPEPHETSATPVASPSPASTPAVPPTASIAPEAKPSGEARVRAITITFDDEAPDAAPSGFSFGRTGKGALGKWLIKAEAGAPSGPYVLAQTDADDTNFRFPLAVANNPIMKDVRVSVRCKVISGRVDQACGLVARYRDENNYFITRANALEDNIRLYTVRDGKRSEIASYSGEVTPNVWHDYRFELKGDQLQVFWDGQRVLDNRDGTFSEAGQVGVWTKADSITHFDDLRVEALQ